MARTQVTVPSEQSLVHMTRHAHESGEPLSTAVASAVAAADDAEPTATGWTLAEYIDPSALDALFDRYSDVIGGHWRFEFDVEQFRVVVENDGVISVYRTP